MCFGVVDNFWTIFFSHPIGIKTKNLSIFFSGYRHKSEHLLKSNVLFTLLIKLKYIEKRFFYERVHWKYFVCCLTYNETNEIPILMMIKCVQWSMGEQSSKPLIRSVRLHCNRLNSKFHKYPRFVSLLNMQLEFLVVNLHMTAVQGPSLQKKSRKSKLKCKSQLNPT